MRTKAFIAIALLSSAGVALAGCETIPGAPGGQYATPMVGAPVTANPTPYSTALNCLQQYARSHNLSSPNIAIGRIEDKTGKVEADGSGRKITGGASEMAMTAFSKAGASLVERFDTSISEMDMRYTAQKLITDAPTPVAGQPQPFRLNYAGQVVGSNFAIYGAITELNWNIASTGAAFDGGSQSAHGTSGHLGGQTYVMNIATDMRVVDTVSMKVVDTISLQKQVIGEEVGLGIFSFMGGHVYDLSAGKSQLEPIQLAVRALMERTAVEVMANFYGMPGPQACMPYDPLDVGYQTAGLTGAYTPAYDNLRTNNAESRADPNRWNSDFDRDVRAARGRY
jgi:curli biogenesis system outer membrane secretion channel CsgG